MSEHPIEVSEDAGVRYLHFGSDWVQGAMRIRRPNALELAYTREMMACQLLRPEASWPRRALLIGLGAASLTKHFFHYLPHCHFTVVEINPSVVAAARQFFKLPAEAEGRFEIVVGDGAAYVEQAEEKFDAILVDGFDPDARAGALDTLAFYRHCRDRLNEQGLFVTNLLGRSRGFAASVKRIADAFEQRTLVFPSGDSGNTIAFAACGEAVEVSTAELKERAEALKKESGLNLLPTLARISEAGQLSGGKLAL
jgi:spermidine synthase